MSYWLNMLSLFSVFNWVSIKKDEQIIRSSFIYLWHTVLTLSAIGVHVWIMSTCATTTSQINVGAVRLWLTVKRKKTKCQKSGPKPPPLKINHQTVATVSVCAELPAWVNTDFLGQKVWESKANTLIIKGNLWTNLSGNDMLLRMLMWLSTTKMSPKRGGTNRTSWFMKPWLAQQIPMWTLENPLGGPCWSTANSLYVMKFQVDSTSRFRWKSNL